MIARLFDAQTGKEILMNEMRGGLTGFTSWRRLAEIFKKAGETATNEEIHSFEVDADGIKFHLDLKE